MSAKSKYYVAFLQYTAFDSLEDAKWNVKSAFTRKQAIKYLSNAHEYIYHFIGDIMVSQTPIHVDKNGNISFGKTYKTYKV